MIVEQAKAVARQWVIEQASATPGFCGAFFHGSVNWLADDANLPRGSDLDVMLVVTEPPKQKLGKFRFHDVLLEVSYLPERELRSAEIVLRQSHLAGSFWRPSIIADPSGHLTRLQAAVSRDISKRHWVYQRCEHARDKVLRNLSSLQSLDKSVPFHDQVFPWLFAAGVTTHILLVAGLKNPTVRLRYVATRSLLADYGFLDFHDHVLEMLGCSHISRARVEQHVGALTAAFDAAKAVIQTPFFFASDISEMARPIAIDGSWALIESGFHREAVFWIAVTYSRCQAVLYQDAPREVQDLHTPGYRRLLADLRITSFDDLLCRGKRLEQSLPEIWSVAEAIIAANPEIEA